MTLGSHPGSPAMGCVALSMPLDLSAPQLPRLGNGDDNSSYLIKEWLWKGNELRRLMSPDAYRAPNTISDHSSCNVIQLLNSNFSKRERGEEEIKEGDNGEEQVTVHKHTCRTARHVWHEEQDEGG